jgi:cardiolipin synthase
VSLGTRLRRLLWSWWLWAVIAAVLLRADSQAWAGVTAGLAVVARLVERRVHPPRFGLDHEVECDSVEFLSAVAGATGTPFVEGNQVEMLHNGDAFYPRMLEDIRRAESSICIEAYIYWAGEVGMQFAAALDERARAGVRVMLLLDAVGAADIGDEILRTLEAHCDVAWYNPLRWRTIGSFNNRTHRKSLIVDGEIGYTGGAGIADHWRGQARNPREWRDVQVRFAGPAVAGLQSGFAHNWQRTTGELVSGAAYYPPVPDSGPYAVQVILSSPETGGSNVQTLYYLSIAGAHHSIVIANPYFVPDEVGLALLVDAARRGVAVRVMVSGIRNDNWLARVNGIALYGALLEAGVAMYEYDRSMLHHKVMVVDGAWLTIGTTNFDSRSFAHNEECNLSVFDAGIAGAFEAQYAADLDACRQVTLDDWRRRGWRQRTGELVARFFADQV